NAPGSDLPKCGIRGSRRVRATIDAHLANRGHAGVAKCLAACSVVPARTVSPRAVLHEDAYRTRTSGPLRGCGIRGAVQAREHHLCRAVVKLAVRVPVGER